MKRSIKGISKEKTLRYIYNIYFKNQLEVCNEIKIQTRPGCDVCVANTFKLRLFLLQEYIYYYVI